MKVIAIRPIQPGEEVSISYVDTAGLKSMRQKELRERYKFKCGCEECEGKEERVDPREAFECPEKGCDGLLAIRGMSFCLPQLWAGSSWAVLNDAQREEENRFVRFVESTSKCPTWQLLSKRRRQRTKTLRRISIPVSPDPFSSLITSSLTLISGRPRCRSHLTLKRHLISYINLSSSISLFLSLIPSPATLDLSASFFFVFCSRLSIRSIRLAWSISSVPLRSSGAVHLLYHNRSTRFDCALGSIARGRFEVLDELEGAESRFEVDGWGIEGMRGWVREERGRWGGREETEGVGERSGGGNGDG